VDACGLKPTGMTQVHGIHGPEKVETYLVNIYLPNNVAFVGERVAKGQMVGGDILIGMSIINQGDFAITNKDGTTMFSFRIPSIAQYDFVKEHNASLRAGRKGRKNRKGRKGRR